MTYNAKRKSAQPELLDREKNARQFGATLRLKRRVSARSLKFMARRRVREIEKFFTDCYGDTLPDNDTGRRWLDILLVHIAESDRANPDQAVRDGAHRWGPWLDDDEHEEMVDQAFNRRRRRRWKADALAKEFGITFAVRQRPKLTTIGAIDMGVAARATRRRKRQNEGRARRRHAKGAKPRSQSLAQTKPWEKLGISERTYYRRKKEAENGPIGSVGSDTPTPLRSSVAERKMHSHHDGARDSAPPQTDELRREWFIMLHRIAMSLRAA